MRDQSREQTTIGCAVYGEDINKVEQCFHIIDCCILEATVAGNGDARCSSFDVGADADCDGGEIN